MDDSLLNRVGKNSRVTQTARLYLIAVALLLQGKAHAGDSLGGFEVGAKFKPTPEWECSAASCVKQHSLAGISGKIGVKLCGPDRIHQVRFTRFLNTNKVFNLLSGVRSELEAYNKRAMQHAAEAGEAFNTLLLGQLKLGWVAVSQIVYPESLALKDMGTATRILAKAEAAEYSGATGEIVVLRHFRLKKGDMFRTVEYTSDTENILKDTLSALSNTYIVSVTTEEISACINGL